MVSLLFVNNMQRGRRTWKVSDCGKNHEQFIYLVRYCLSYDVTGRVAMDQAQTSCDCGTHRGALYFAVDYGVLFTSGNTASSWSRSVLVFAMAFHQLRIYKFRMDMAVAGPRWTYLRMVNLNCCRLVGYCTAVTKLWKSIFANFYYAGYQ